MSSANNQRAKPMPEIEILHKYLKDKIATCTEAHKATGIDQKNLCRYKRELEKNGHLFVCRKGVCPETKMDGVQFITTNYNLVPKNLQLSLFSENNDPFTIPYDEIKDPPNPFNPIKE